MKAEGLPAVSEEYFFDQVLELAHDCGYILAHFRPARTKYGWVTAVAGDGRGFPDCIITKLGRTIIAELKTNSRKSKLSIEQARWLLILRRTPGLEVFIWRPRQWDRIVSILQRR